MLIDELNEDSRKFLLQLLKQTNGDVSVQVSMYDVGSMLDLDRNGASRAAEELIGFDLVEIRTLSGGIGITEAALEVLQESGAGQTPAAADTVGLGEETVLASEARAAVEQITGRLKQSPGDLGLAFDDLTEVMADIKTIDTQMGSSRPKTAIIRECLRSLKSGLEKTDAADIVTRIKTLLQE